eukprot:6486953-Prymnesium_polylepis.2
MRRSSARAARRSFGRRSGGSATRAVERLPGAVCRSPACGDGADRGGLCVGPAVLARLCGPQPCWAQLCGTQRQLGGSRRGAAEPEATRWFTPWRCGARRSAAPRPPPASGQARARTEGHAAYGSIREGHSATETGTVVLQGTQTVGAQAAEMSCGAAWLAWALWQPMGPGLRAKARPIGVATTLPARLRRTLSTRASALCGACCMCDPRR